MAANNWRPIRSKRYVGVPIRTKACGLGGQTFRTLTLVAQTGETQYAAAMENLSYSITGEVFAIFPDYIRGVVLATAVTNGPSPADLVALLRDAEASLRARLTIDQLADHPQIRSWREAYRSFGAKPSEYRSSIEALARRAFRGEPLPTINALVDIGNIVSLRHLVPVGGHALDVLSQDIRLCRATGTEIFVPFGSDQPEHPLPGEIVFVEGQTVLTRRWTWRQANHTLTLPQSTAVEFNVDGLPPVTAPEVEAICQETMELVRTFCGGQLRYEVLSRHSPRMDI